MSSQARAWLELDERALINNANVVAHYSKAAIVAVVKANAYGHGLEFVCRTLKPYVAGFAVAALDEAQSLRQLFSDSSITLLGGFYHPAQIDVIKQQGIDPVIFNVHQIDWLELTDARGLCLALKIDTGMGRLGIAPQQLASSLMRLRALDSQITLMSHFASADQPDSSQNEDQHEAFKRVCQPFQLPRSFANSAAIVSRPQDHYEFIRPGIMLYGSSPLQGVSARSLNLKPVMRLYARVLDIKTIRPGESVGYGATWVASRQTKIALISIGYGDGYPRIISHRARVVIGSKRFALVGRVSMDSLAVKLGETDEVRVGDRVELWGEKISADEVASWAGTIAYELFCKVTRRVTRSII